MQGNIRNKYCLKDLSQQRIWNKDQLWVKDLYPSPKGHSHFSRHCINEHWWSSESAPAKIYQVWVTQQNSGFDELSKHFIIVKICYSNEKM